MKKKLLGLMVLLLLIGFSSPAFSGAAIRADGQLTARGEDGAILIDGSGYLASSGLKVQDSEGKPLLLGSIVLPAQVSFEYRYTGDGPVISFITVNTAVPR